MTPAAVAADLAHFVGPEQYTELRALNVGGPGRCFSGWFDGRHLLDLARNALALTRQAAGVYFIPNPVNPAVASRRLNTVLNVPKGFRLTHDEDVLERRFLIVDIDPTRYVGQDQECPSSAHELIFARTVARDAVVPFLRAAGWPDPMVMLSGNGIHLVYQIVPAIKVTEWGRVSDPLAAILGVLGDRFTCTGATIDSNTYNPCRMLKVPGTYARKGDATQRRPHRAARIIEVPNGWSAPDAPGVRHEGLEPVEPDRQVGAEGHHATAPVERPTFFNGGRDSSPVH